MIPAAQKDLLKLAKMVIKYSRMEPSMKEIDFLALKLAPEAESCIRCYGEPKDLKVLEPLKR